MRMLAPLLGRFQEAHPHIVLEVAIEDTFTDIVKHRIDAGIRLGEAVDRDMVAVKFGADLRTATVAAPVYLARHGEPVPLLTPWMPSIRGFYLYYPVRQVSLRCLLDFLRAEGVVGRARGRDK